MKIWKLLMVITVLIMTSFILCSCEVEDSNTQNQIEASPPLVSGFVVINIIEDVFYGTDQYILYDPETYVMYSAFIYSHTKYKEGGITITPMYDVDGSIRVYTP